jgi:cyclin-A
MGSNTCLQMKYRARPDYIQTIQRRVTKYMRKTLVDWLIDVAEDFRLVTESLYLTVAYIDRYLSVTNIHPSELQQLGMGCMSIATKFEEIYPPPVERLADMTANNCSVDSIVNAENQILKTLDFHIAVPTAKVWQRC